MLNKKLIMFTIFFVSLLTISAVNAGDVNATSEELTVVEYVNVDSSMEDMELNNEEPVGTFTELSDLFETSEKEVLELDKDYSFNATWVFDDQGIGTLECWENPKEININKSMTIDGKGHTIDLNEVNFNQPLFKINKDNNVVFKNIKFKDSHVELGSVICFEGSGSIINCTFDDCRAHMERQTSISDEGLISFSGQGNVVNCSFIGCKVYYGKYPAGGGIVDFKSLAYIENCNFIRCNPYNAYNCGIVNCKSIGYVKDCSFINYMGGNSDDRDFANIVGAKNVSGCSFVGSPHVIYNVDSVVNCSFVGCSNSAVNSVGAVVNCSFVGCFNQPISRVDSVVNCSFMNCSNCAASDSVIYGANNVANCSFVNCSGWRAGAIINYDFDSNMNYIINCKFENCYSNGNVDDFKYPSSAIYAPDLCMIINCSFIGDSWSSNRGIGIYNVTVNGVCHEFSFIDLSKDNNQISLTKNYTINNAPFLISGNNVVIDGNGYSVDTNSSLTDAFNIIGSNVTIKNINFVHVGIASKGLNTTIINCNFTDYHKDVRNGFLGYVDGIICFYDDAYGCKITNCNFNDISSYDCINGIYFDKKGYDIDIINCSFVNCSSWEEEGSAINSRIAVNLNIDSCNFIKCTNVAIETEGESKIKNCNFMNCRSHYGQGGALTSKGSANIDNCSFVNCSSNGGGYYEGSYGGAIYFYYLDSGNNKIINCRFINNAASIGSAIYFENRGKYYQEAYLINTSFEGDNWYSDSPVSLSNVSIDGVKVSLWDSLTDGSQITIMDDCYINYSAIPIKNSNVVIDGNGHTINSSLYWALYITGNNITLKNIIFDNANVFSSDVNLTLINCSFVNCSADYNGGLRCAGGKLINCNFIKCSAVDGYYLYNEAKLGFILSVVNCNFINGSGGFMLYSKNTINIINTSFINCSEGAIRNSGGKSSLIDNCRFINCHSSESGAAINGGYDGFSILNSKFINCSADSNGGAINIEWTNEIGNCSFINCSAGEKGGAILFYSQINIHDCIFINNKDLNNNAIFLYEISHSKISSISDSFFSGGKWFSNLNCIEVSNVIVDNESYPNLHNLLEEDNVLIELSPENIVHYSPIMIMGKNVVIDGKGNTLRGNGNNIFSIVANNVTIKNINFINGGIYSSKGDNTIINCTFQNFKYFDDSSPISGSGDVLNCNFVNCRSFAGGAIHRASNVLNCTFVNCSTDNSSAWNNMGGAIHTAGNVVNCSFVDCYSKDGGSAIYGANRVINCTFTNTSGLSNRYDVQGVISHSGDVVNCSFINCPLSIGYSRNVIGCSFVNGYCGSAIFESGDVVNCSFVNCSSNKGGAVYNSKNIANCTFINCFAAYDTTSYGGAICSEKYDKYSIVNCNFKRCFTNSEGSRDYINYGGAIYALHEDILNCSFENCHSGVGGAILIGYYGDTSNIMNCSFANCSVNSCGGAISVGDNPSNSEVYDFYSYYDSYGKCNIVECSFVNCSASEHIERIYREIYGWIEFEAAGYGSAIGVTRYYNSYIVNCSFIDCYSKNGYAIRSYETGSLINSMFSGDTYFYDNDAEIFNVTISNIDSSIEIKDLNFDYADYYLIFVTLKGADSVIVDVINHSEAIVNVNKDVINISNLSVGDYTLNITTLPKTNFNPTSVLVNMTINKIDSSINLSEEKITLDYGSVGMYEIILEGATDFTTCLDGGNGSVQGIVPLTFESTYYIIISDLDVGNYTLYITTIPDRNHNELTKSFEVTVNKIRPNLSINVENIKYGESTNITVCLNIDADVTLELNNQNYTQQVCDGKTVFKISDLKSGTYPVSVTFLGNENYDFYTVSDMFEVSKISIGSYTISKTIKKDNFTIQFPSDATGNVTITINNKRYVSALLEGKASINLSKLSNGEYTYKLIYSGDDKYYGLSINSKTLTINRTNAGTINPDIVIPPLENVSANVDIPIKLPDDATGNVTLTVNGKDYRFDVSNGVANLKLPDLSNGDYTYTIKYSGDGKYSSFTSGGKLKVNKTTINPADNTTKLAPDVVVPSLDKPSKDGFVEVKLPSDAMGTVTLTVNNKDYKFDVSNGVANVKLPDLGNGNYPYTITYSGDGKYSSFTETGSLTVNKPLQTTNPTTSKTSTTTAKTVVKTKITLKKVKVKKSAKKLVLQATLKKGKTPLKGKKITFKFNGKKYTAKTNKKGIAKVTIKKKVLKKLKVGKKVKYQASYGKIVAKKTIKVKK